MPHRDFSSWIQAQRAKHSDERGITYTIEAVLGLAILASIIVAIGTGLLIAVDDDELAQKAMEEQLEREGTVALEKAESHGAIKQTILSWDEGEDEWAAPGTDTENGELVSLPANTFGTELNRLIDERDVVVNVHLYPTGVTGAHNPEDPLASGTVSREEPIPLYTSGTPGDQTVTVTATIPLYTSDRLQPTERAHQQFPADPQKTRTGEERLGDLGFEASYPVPTIFDTGEVYNIVVVEVVIWDV